MISTLITIIMFNIIVIALILNPNGGAVTAVYWTTKDQSHQQQRHHNRQNWTHIGINQTSTYCCDNSIAIGIIFALINMVQSWLLASSTSEP